jgi:hypothetical protein
MPLKMLWTQLVSSHNPTIKALHEYSKSQTSTHGQSTEIDFILVVTVPTTPGQIDFYLSRFQLEGV